MLRLIPPAHQDDFKSVHRESLQHGFDSSEHSSGISCRERWIVKTTERVRNKNVLGSKAVAGEFELMQDDVLEFGGRSRWKMALPRSSPVPGQENTVSIRIDPPSRYPS